MLQEGGEKSWYEEEEKKKKIKAFIKVCRVLAISYALSNLVFFQKLLLYNPLNRWRIGS